VWAPRLYLITDRTRTRGRDLIEEVEAALAGGADAVQLREKDIEAHDLLELALRLKQACGRHKAKLLINDRIDVALAARADGVHLPATSFHPADARQLLGLDTLIGVSTHSCDEVRRAVASGADFVVFGPVFETDSKRQYGAPQGIEKLTEVCATVAAPVVAVGGINADNIGSVRRAGAHGAAIIGAIIAADEPRQAASSLKAAFSSQPEDY